MKTSTTILCILLPVLLTLYVRQPEVFSLDMGISGTSDVLAIPLLLPKAQVLALLPPHIRDESALIVPTTEELEALFGAKALQSTAESTGGALHPVFIQLARQHATGLGPNWLPKMTFGEAKLEVPYVRHPALRQDISTEKKDAPFVFKQTILLSKKILALGSQYQAGLKSHHAQFSPLETPSCYEAGAQTIQYAAEGFIEATATKITDDTGAASVGFENLDGLGPSWGRIEEILGALWFGGNTGQIATKASWELLLYHWVAVWKVHADWIENSQFIFDFENAEIKPEPYSVQLKLNLAAFAEEGEGSLKNLEVNGIGWRFKAKMSATAGKAVNMV